MPSSHCAGSHIERHPYQIFHECVVAGSDVSQQHSAITCNFAWRWFYCGWRTVFSHFILMYTSPLYKPCSLFAFWETLRQSKYILKRKRSNHTQDSQKSQAQQNPMLYRWYIDGMRTVYCGSLRVCILSETLRSLTHEHIRKQQHTRYIFCKGVALVDLI